LLFAAVVRKAGEAKLMSDDDFTVDGNLIEARRSPKSFRSRGEDPSEDKDQGGPRNRWVNFLGEKRSNETISIRAIPRGCWPPLVVEGTYALA